MREDIPPSFTVKRSADNGATWTSGPTTIADQYFPGHAGTFHQQPMLYELPRTVGQLAAGTVLFIGNFGVPGGPLVPTSGTNPARIEEVQAQALEVFASDDAGRTWRPMGQPCDTGGPSDGHGIWEPYLQVAGDGSLVCYYSDETQRDLGPNYYNQAIVERVAPASTVTHDSIGWGPKTNIVEVPTTTTNTLTDHQRYDMRPGMPTVQSLPNGQYVLAYEMVISQTAPPGQVDFNTSDIRIKFSQDGVHWAADDLGRRVISPDGHFLGGTPELAYIPQNAAAGLPNGELVLDGQSYFTRGHGWDGDSGRMLLVNTNYGQGAWFPVPAQIALRSTPFLADGCGNYKPGLVPLGGAGLLVLTPQVLGTDVDSDGTITPYCDISAAPTTNVAPQALAVSVGIDNGPSSDNQPRILWDYPDGHIVIDTLKDNLYNATTIQTGLRTVLTYRPADASWFARGIAVGNDGTGETIRILWMRDDGTTSLWQVPTTGGNPLAYTNYGPYGDIKPIAVAAGPDGAWRVLWQRDAPITHTISLWLMDGRGTTLRQNWAADPADGSWNAVGVAVGGDYFARVLWNHTDWKPRLSPDLWIPGDRGAGALYTVAQNPDTNTGAVQPPIPVTNEINDVNVLGVGSGANGRWRLLWGWSNKAMSLWDRAPSGVSDGDSANIERNTWEPVNDPTWTASAIAVDQSNRPRVLFSNQRGAAVLWTFSADGTGCPTPTAPNTSLSSCIIADQVITAP